MAILDGHCSIFSESILPDLQMIKSQYGDDADSDDINNYRNDNDVFEDEDDDYNNYNNDRSSSNNTSNNIKLKKNNNQRLYGTTLKFGIKLSSPGPELFLCQETVDCLLVRMYLNVSR